MMVEQIKKLLAFLESKRNNWTWLFVRLLMCVCVINLAAYVLTTLVLIVCPFISLIAGDGIVGFLGWYFVPVTCAVSWILYDVCKMIYHDYLNSGLY